MTGEFTQRGWGRIGRRYLTTNSVSWPLARIAIGEDGILIDLAGFRRYYSRSQITRLSKYRVLFLTHLRIEHNKPDDIDPFVLFGTFNFRRLKRNLIEFGYVVDEGKPQRT